MLVKFMMSIGLIKCREHRKHLLKFLNQIEIDKAAKLCNAVQCNERLFWKLLKNQKASSQMSAFIVDGKMITDKNHICKMWAEHFENYAHLQPTQILTVIFLIDLVPVFRNLWRPAKIIHLEILMNHLHKKLQIFVLNVNQGFQVFSLIMNMHVLLDEYCGTSWLTFIKNFLTDLQFVNL